MFGIAAAIAMVHHENKDRQPVAPLTFPATVTSARAEGGIKSQVKPRPKTPTPTVTPGDYTFSFPTKDGLTRSYMVHIPKGYTPTKKYPVLFGFHGEFGTAEAFANSTAFSSYSDARGFIVVYGQGTALGPVKSATNWNAGSCCGQAVTNKKNIDDVSYMRKVVQDIESKYAVDTSRIYITGMSNGSMFSNRLICQVSDIIAGAATVSGTFQIPFSSCTPSKQVPILVIHGTKDTTVPYYGGAGSGAATKSNTFIPVEKEFAEWGTRNGCSGAITTISVPPLETTDGNTVDELTYPSCTQQVVLYRVNGGVHEWPSGLPGKNPLEKGSPSKALNASLTIVDFFHL